MRFGLVVVLQSPAGEKGKKDTSVSSKVFKLRAT